MCGREGEECSSCATRQCQQHYSAPLPVALRPSCYCNGIRFCCSLLSPRRLSACSGRVQHEADHTRPEPSGDASRRATNSLIAVTGARSRTRTRCLASNKRQHPLNSLARDAGSSSPLHASSCTNQPMAPEDWLSSVEAALL